MKIYTFTNKKPNKPHNSSIYDVRYNFFPNVSFNNKFETNKIAKLHYIIGVKRENMNASEKGRPKRIYCISFLIKDQRTCKTANFLLI